MRFERPGSAVGDDGARDARRQSLLAEFSKYANQLGFGGAVDHVGGARALILVHAHIERPVVHEAEAAGGVVELRRGDAQIEQHAVEFEAGLDLIGARRECGKARAKNRDARIGAEARLRFGDGDRIAVETKQSAISDELLQNRPCMSAPPKSGVQVGATRPYVQRGQYLW